MSRTNKYGKSELIFAALAIVVVNITSFFGYWIGKKRADYKLKPIKAVEKNIKLRKKAKEAVKKEEAVKPRKKTKEELRLEEKLSKIDEKIDDLDKPIVEVKKPKRKIIKEIIRKAVEAVKPRKKTKEDLRLEEKLSKIDGELEDIDKLGAVSEKERFEKLGKRIGVVKLEVLEDILDKKEKELEELTGEKKKEKKTKEGRKLDREISEINRQIEDIRKPIVEKPKKKTIKEIVKKAVEVINVMKKTKEELKLDKRISEIDEKLMQIRGKNKEGKL